MFPLEHFFLLLLRHSSARPSGWNAFKYVTIKSRYYPKRTRRTHLLTNIWQTHRGTYTHATAFSIHFYSNHHNNSKWNQMHHVGEHRHGRVIFINTANKKSRVRRYFSLVLRSLNWACHPAVHPTSGLKIEKEKEKNSLHHASFTYVLTATTSPMMHFCVERRHQVIRRNLHVHQLWQTSRRAYNHIRSHWETYLLKICNYINLPQVCCGDVFISCKTPHLKTNTFFLIILTWSLSINSIL